MEGEGGVTCRLASGTDTVSKVEQFIYWCQYRVGIARDKERLVFISHTLGACIMTGFLFRGLRLAQLAHQKGDRTN